MYNVRKKLHHRTLPNSLEVHNLKNWAGIFIFKTTIEKTVKYNTIHLCVADHLHLCVAWTMDLQGQGGVEA